MSGNMRRSQNPFEGVPYAAMNPGQVYPIQQHFTAPSTHFINVFNTPGDYGVTYQFNPVTRGSAGPPPSPAASHIPIDQASLSPTTGRLSYTPLSPPPPAPCTPMPTPNGGAKRLSPPIPTHRASHQGADGPFNMSP